MNKQFVIPEKILSLNPLFWSGQGPVAVNPQKPNIFIGTGIATPTKISQAIPFDALGFLLSAEFIKRQIPHSQVFLLIADQHAWLANNFTKKAAQKIARLQFETFTRVINSLNLNHWHLFLASQLFPNAKPASYESLETRDVNHFINHHQVGLKLGWKFPAGKTAHKTDEAHFDQDLNIVSIFTKPGVTADPHKPQESPYICTDLPTRVLLAKTLHPRGVTNPAVQNHLKRTTILFERLFGAFPPKTPLDQKVKLILKQTFN